MPARGQSEPIRVQRVRTTRKRLGCQRARSGRGPAGASGGSPAGAARVKELGGEADDPMPVPAMGWFVTCKDTQGNEFGLWQNDTSAPAPTG